MNYQHAQFNMIEQQIRPWNVLSQPVLDTLYAVKREGFVLPEYRPLAYADLELPIGHGQTMLPPRVEAQFIQALALEPTDRVLEIGGGSGYMAALLAHQAQSVVTQEIHPELAQFARDNLARAGIKNVTVNNCNGLNSKNQTSTFDAIVLSGSVPELPQFLQQHLSPTGRIVAIVGQAPVMRAVFLNLTAARDFVSETLFETVLPRLVAGE